MTGRSIFLILAALFVFAQQLKATNSDEETRLLRHLAAEYKPGLLTFGNHGRDSSGAYIWAATFHRELNKPREKLASFCRQNGGALRLALSAGRIQNRMTSALLGLGGRSYIVAHRDLWEWAGRGYDAGSAGVSGFDAVMPRQLITGRTRTIAAADLDPPLGLFVCVGNDGPMLWAASIMPGAYGGSGWFYMTIRAVTSDYLEQWDKKRYEAEQLTHEARGRTMADASAADAFVASENKRLAPFRRVLTIGSDTNCGLVINDRGPVLEVQLPSGMTGPHGERQFWAKRESLADYPAPKGCNFGRD